MDYRAEIAEALSQALASESFGIEKSAAECLDLLEVPKDSKMGDHAFPCFSLAKALRKGPAPIAGELLAEVQYQLTDSSNFSSIVAVGPYLNFTVNKSSLAQALLPQILSEEFTAKRASNSSRMMIEYSQPNTHKAFHVGHMRNVALGDAMVRICEWAGYEVVAANYIGDVGAHIAKCLWYYKNYFNGEVPTTRRGEFLGGLYSEATHLLDYKALTRSPHPLVISAKVLSKTVHEKNADWQVVGLDLGKEEKQVVCGGSGYQVGDIVAYATVGSRIGGRDVNVADKDGTTSEGMICSEAEISISGDRQKIFVFESEVGLGVEIAELLVKADANLEPGKSVLETMAFRSEGVSKMLQALEAKEGEIHELWLETRQWSLDDFQEIYDWVEARFDHCFYESEVGDSGKKIVKEFHEKGVFELSEGAIGVNLEEYSMPFFLLLKSDGTGLYSTKDLSLAQLKFDQFEIDRSIYVVDYTQSLHFNQVFKTLELMGYEKAALCHHLSYGMVTATGGKMSSRGGNVILFSELREKLTSKIKDEHLAERDWAEDQIEEACKRVALGTIKYGMLNQDSKKNIVFDMDEWTSATGNTGPYLMYAYMRTQAIMRALPEQDFDNANYELLQHESEQELLAQLAKFQETVIFAAENYQANQLCNFLYDTCRSFSRMYAKCSAKNAETPELQCARAALIKATGIVLRAGLELIGIKPLDRM